MNEWINGCMGQTICPPPLGSRVLSAILHEAVCALSIKWRALRSSTPDPLPLYTWPSSHLNKLTRRISLWPVPQGSTKNRYRIFSYGNLMSLSLNNICLRKAPDSLDLFIKFIKLWSPKKFNDSLSWLV